MTTEAKHELRERAMLKPFKLRTYKSAFEGQEPLTALNIPGKTVDGRNWTSYIDDAKGTEVLQVCGCTYEEASETAASILRAINNHDALLESLARSKNMLVEFRAIADAVLLHGINETIQMADAALAAAQE